MLPWIREDTQYSGLKRVSEDKTVNQFGNYLLTHCEIFGLTILNGTCEGDIEGKCTYVTTSGCTSSVIDYYLCSYDLLKLNLHLQVGQEILSKHFPLELNIKKKQNIPEVDSSLVDNKNTQVIKIIWDVRKKEQMIQATYSEDAVALYNEAISMIKVDLNKTSEVFTSYLTYVSKCMSKTIKYSAEPSKDPTWFDNECKQKRLVTRRALRRYRKSRKDDCRLMYCNCRKEYKIFTKMKMEQYKKEQVTALTEASKNNVSFWSTVRSLLRKPQPRPNIALKQWQTYFTTLLNIANGNNDVKEDMETYPTDYCHLTDKPITVDEINEAVRH